MHGVWEKFEGTRREQAYYVVTLRTKQGAIRAIHRCCATEEELERVSLGVGTIGIYPERDIPDCRCPNLPYFPA